MPDEEIKSPDAANIENGTQEDSAPAAIQFHPQVPVLPMLAVDGLAALDRLMADANATKGLSANERAAITDGLSHFVKAGYAKPPPEPIADPEPEPDPDPDPLLEYRELVAQLAAQGVKPDEVLVWKQASDQVIADAQKPAPPEPTVDEAMDAAVSALDAVCDRKVAEQTAAIRAQQAVAKEKLNKIKACEKSPDTFIGLDDKESAGHKLMLEWANVHRNGMGYSKNDHEAIDAFISKHKTFFAAD